MVIIAIFYYTLFPHHQPIHLQFHPSPHYASLKLHSAYMKNHLKVSEIQQAASYKVSHVTVNKQLN